MRPVSSVATVNEFVTNLGKTLRGLHGSFSQFGSEELRQRFEYAVRALEISRQSLVEVRGFVLTDSLQCRLDDLQVSLNRIQGCLKALQTRAVDVEKLHTKLLCRLSNRRLLNLYVAKSDILSTMKIMHTFRSLWNRMHDEEWLIENASSLSQNLMSASDDLDETLQRGSSEDVSQPLVSNIYEILSWVAGSEDQALLHEHYRAERIPGTYEWFLETDTNRSWLQATLPQGDRGLFWCQGKPGIGKTILTSKVIEELKHAHLVAYFYMSHGKLYSASEVTATLLKQLCLQRGIVPARLRQLYEHSKGGTGRLLRLVDMLSALKETSQAIVQPTVVIVDGLDEFNMSQRQDFVRILDELRQTSWKCLVRSRSHQDVLTETPRGYTQFSIKEVETTRHIQDFVERILAGNEPIDQMLSNQSDLRAEVINTPTSRSHRILGSREFRRALQDIPDDVEGMSNTALKVLQRQEDGRLQLAIHALALLTAAAEPMTAGTLSHAMGIAYSLLNDDQPQELKEDEVPNTAVIIECFMGLAETHPLTGIATLRAADIEQRIRKHWDDFFGHGSKVQNTELCLAYLSLDAFSNGACDQIDALGRRLEHYPFLHHASRYWGSHAREASSLLPIDGDSTEMCMRFLEKRANLDSALQVAQIESQLRDALHRGKWPDLDLSLAQCSSISSLQIASRHGLTKVVQKRIQSDDCAVSKHDCHGTSALHEAAGAGWEDTVNVLLEAGAQPFLVDDENKIPLFYAATNSHFGIVSILKNQRGNAPMTPTQARDFARIGYSQSVSSALELAFYDAAGAGKIDVVNRLLQGGVSPDLKKHGKSALLMAVNGGHEGIIQLILEKSADLSCPDRLPSKNIPLHQAIACCHVNIATMLLEYGANIETRDDHQRTALFESLSVRGLDGAALLLSEGIDMSATDCFGDTVLHQAAARGLVGHVMRFLDQGMEVNSINNEGWTPLHFAADRGDERTVELLVQSGADVNIADFSERTEWTPFMIIVSAGNDRLCKLLLRKCNVDESNMRDAVTEAALEGHSQVLEMLLQECEDTDADLAARDLGFLRSLAKNNDDT